MTMIRKGICALCKKNRTFRESHIVPGLVIDWLKKTSRTGHIRSSDVVNLRVQDGYKIPKTILKISHLKTKLSTRNRTKKTFGIFVNFCQFYFRLGILIDTFWTTLKME